MADSPLHDAMQRLRVQAHLRLAQRLGLHVDRAWLEARTRELDDEALWRLIEAQGSAAPQSALSAMARWWRRVTAGE